MGILPYRSVFVTACGYSMHVTEWGDPEGEVVVMWHGLARTGRDFDTLAAHMAQQGYRVLCPDTLGRGLSQWAASPEEEYLPTFYAKMAVEMLDSLGVNKLRWVGTSMGGIVGMLLAATSLRDRITQLVLNDIAPVLNPVAVERIKAYVGATPEFGTVQEVEAALRFIYKPFGALSDEEWRTMAVTSCRRLPSGKLTLHYDPSVMEVFRSGIDDYNLWELYDAIGCNTLLLRGQESDLVMEETAAEMQTRGPKCRFFEVPGCGHAPMLNAPEQWKLVEGFFAEAA